MNDDDDYCDADELDFVAQRTAEETRRRIQPKIDFLEDKVKQLEKKIAAYEQTVDRRFFSSNLASGQVNYLRNMDLTFENVTDTIDQTCGVTNEIDSRTNQRTV